MTSIFCLFDDSLSADMHSFSKFGKSYVTLAFVEEVGLGRLEWDGPRKIVNTTAAKTGCNEHLFPDK